MSFTGCLFQSMDKGQVHVKNQRVVIFGDDADLLHLVEAQRILQTTLTEYIAGNREVAERAARGETLEFDCHELFYRDVTRNVLEQSE